MIAAIFARAGSKGLPGKNLLRINGRPLVAIAVEQARQVSGISAVYCSTDSEEIADAASSAGARIPFMRPARLSTDDSPEWESWRHLLTHLRDSEGETPSALLSVPPTTPLRTVEDIERIKNEFMSRDCDVAFGVVPAARNPMFNMVSLDQDGNAQLAIAPEVEFSRRQDGPEFWDMTTAAYCASSSFVLSGAGIWAGRARGVEVSPYCRIDIDTENDYEVAKALSKAGAGKGIHSSHD